MSFLVNLPESICVEIFVVWCEVKDLATLLDTAFCSKKDRHKVLALFTCDHVCLTYVPNSLRWVSKRNIKMRSLVLLRRHFCDKKLKYHPNTSLVTELLISSCGSREFGDANLLKFINSCPLLSSLVFDGVECFSDAVLLRIDPQIVKNFVEVHWLNCTEKLSGKSIRHLALHCESLIKFRFSSGCQTICDSDFVTLVEANKKLVVFNVNAPTASITGGKITDKTLQAIVKNCPCIQQLVLYKCQRLDIDSVLDLFRRHGQQQLELVTVSTERGINSETFCFCTDWGERRNQKYLFVTGFLNGQEKGSNSALLMELFTIQKGFHNISLDGVTHLSDELFMCIARNNPGLRELTLAWWGESTVPGLKAVLAQCRKLRKMSLKYSHHFCPHELCDIFETPNSLTSLDIHENDEFGAFAVIHILHANPQLRAFDFSGCRFVHVKTVKMYLKEMGRKVKLGKCREFDDCNCCMCGCGLE